MRRARPPKKLLGPPSPLSPSQPVDETPLLAKNLSHNLEQIERRLSGSNDIVIRRLAIAGSQVEALVVFTDGLVNRDTIEGQILHPVMLELAMTKDHNGCLTAKDILVCLERKAVTVGEQRRSNSLDEIILAVLSGDTCFLVDGFDFALILNSRGWPARGVQEPLTETVIRGPRDGFTETMRANTALLRRHLRDPNFKISQFRTGRRSQTDCALAYLEGVVRPDLVEAVKKRLATIDIDRILESGEIEQLIEDSSWSLFPQVQYSERPDKVVAAITEGRVAILVDGTPFALMVPAVFGNFFTSPEDYYDRWIYGSITRSLRIIGSYLASFLPALFVSTISFHPNLLPTPLVMAIAASRQGLPFPVVVEALLMEVSFELLREAGARLPRPIGQTIGIVGGIIIGDAAVRSRLISPIMVIVVSLTAIAAFVIPSYNLANAFRLLRFPLIVGAGVLGLYGVVIGFILINVHMVCLKSFGVVYLSPFAPYRHQDWKDLLIRAPIRTLIHRPETFQPQDRRRQINHQKGGW